MNAPGDLDYTHRGRGVRVKGGVLTRARNLGIAGDNEALRLAVASLLAGYQQAIDTLPEGSGARRLVEGAFGHSPEIARQILDAV